MPDGRRRIETIEDARVDLGGDLYHPAWRENSHTLPIGELSSDEFEILCYLLLKAENPNDEIIYYGKSADLGRDIIHKRADGTCLLIQCKRYSQKVDKGRIREELAKLIVNVFKKKIPVEQDEV